MTKPSSPRFRVFASLVVVALLVASVNFGCQAVRPVEPAGKKITMEVTAYCACQSCCGWKRDWLGRPIFASGPLKGKRKRVGITADGTKAAKGTIAADTRYYPFGTRLYVPGYGYGTVHDTGGAIKGRRRLDLFFKSHKDALKWGRQRLTVTVLR